MLMIHKGMEHLGLLETIIKQIEIPVEWVDKMCKDDLEITLAAQIEYENYEGAKIIQGKLKDISF